MLEYVHIQLFTDNQVIIAKMYYIFATNSRVIDSNSEIKYRKGLKFPGGFKVVVGKD